MREIKAKFIAWWLSLTNFTDGKCRWITKCLALTVERQLLYQLDVAQLLHRAESTHEHHQLKTTSARRGGAGPCEEVRCTWGTMLNIHF